MLFRFNLKHGFVFIGFLSCLLVCVNAENRMPKDNKDVISFYKDALDKVETIRCQYTVDQNLTEKGIEVELLNCVDYITLIQSSDRIFRDVSRFEKKGNTKEPRNREVKIWNGKAQYVLRGKQFDPNWKVSPEMTVEAEHKEFLVFGPEQVFQYLPGFNLSLLEILNFTHLNDPVTHEEIDGKKAYFISVDYALKQDEMGRNIIIDGKQYHIDFWISAEIFLPLKYAFSVYSTQKQNYLIDRYFVVGEYEDFNGVFFPVHGEKNGDPHASQTYDAKVDSIVLNEPVDEDTFRPKLEPGTWVFDYIMNTHHIYLPDDLANVDENLGRLVAADTIGKLEIQTSKKVAAEDQSIKVAEVQRGIDNRTDDESETIIGTSTTIQQQNFAKWYIYLIVGMILIAAAYFVYRKKY